MTTRLAKLVRCSGCPTESAMRVESDRLAPVGLVIGQTVVVVEEYEPFAAVLELEAKDHHSAWQVLLCDLEFLT